jgi:hypothetical protein
MARHRLTVLLVGLLAQGGIALAAPLDKDGCGKLKDEQGQLEKSGVRETLAKGPQWAKTNLAGGSLGEVRRLIEVDEQLLFRCSGKPLVVLPLESEGAANATDDKEGPETPSAKASGGETSPPAVKRATAQEAEKKTSGGQAKAAASGRGRKGPAVSSTTAPAKQGSGAAEEAGVGSNSQPKVTAKSTPKATPKTKSQPKPDDAYRPPDGDAKSFSPPAR